MSRLADIYVVDGSLHIWGSNADYSDCIKLRTAADFLELLRDLVAAGNAHFGTTARLIEASGELNIAQLLADAETVEAGTYTWAEHQAANQAALDEIAQAMGVQR